jgi:type II secretory pathway pseudopilin PulG
VTGWAWALVAVLAVWAVLATLVAVLLGRVPRALAAQRERNAAGHARAEEADLKQQNGGW